MAWKRLHQEQRIKPRRKATKINWEHLGLDTPAKERQPVPMDEIRRQVLMLAGRALGQGVRARRLLQGEQGSNSDRHLETARRDRRGATR
ncbi:MAG: hypothetical protein FJ249_06410 [Nitrospira sp.]|nr:hypothetical protein [Nitrospira sp.]